MVNWIPCLRVIKLDCMAKKGSKISEYHKKRISEANRGRKMSKEQKLFLSKINLGNKNNLGRHPNEEVKKKISNSLMGRKQSLETKLKRIKSLRRGKDHWAWKGGIYPLVMRIRTCSKYRQWRCDVFERDDYTCLICAKKGSGNLNADHYPKPFSIIFRENNIVSLEQAIACEELWNINNGRTLCAPCHKNAGSYGRRNIYRK